MRSLANITALGASLAALGLAVPARTATAQDPAVVSPGNYKALFENERVRVLEMRLKPGEQDKQHSHPSEVVYFVKAAKVEITLPDGEVVKAELKAGEVLWHEAWTHTVRNTGTEELHAIIVELKKGT
ncbi:MAG: cupin domain-containing protein [Gemmatimonadetes bacterium]|nr:cupin domain-containing protein [Gemmatimonadota bacterium]